MVGWHWIQVKVARFLADNGYDVLRFDTIGIGDSDNAFKWLEIALEHRDMQMILLNTAIEYRTLRSDPRFENLLKKLGLP